MISLEQKQALISELKARLVHEYETLAAAQQATVAGATHEEAKPENDKDTRALEQSYLARGQAARVVQLQADIEVLSRLRPRIFEEENAIGLTALVRVEEDDEAQLYLLSPVGAGEQMESPVGLVKIATANSPLGRALMGAHLDDEVSIVTPKGKRLLTIVDLR